MSETSEPSIISNANTLSDNDLVYIINTVHSYGLKVFLMEDHELPLIDVRMQFRSGSNYEPANKTGLADLFGQFYDLSVVAGG